MHTLVFTLCQRFQVENRKENVMFTEFRMGGNFWRFVYIYSEDGHDSVLIVIMKEFKDQTLEYEWKGSRLEPCFRAMPFSCSVLGALSKAWSTPPF